MDANDIANLIRIRDYAANSVNNLYIDRKTATALNSMVTALDAKLAELIQSDEFKSYINFKAPAPAPTEKVIKSALRKI